MPLTLHGPSLFLEKPGAPPPAERSAGPLIVYPIDRSASTPLTAFCPTDVLRNTLGVGPCQYILDTEGLASQPGLTPGQAIDRVQRQFDKDNQRASAGQIEQYLGQMTAQVGRAQARIEKYADLARQVRALCTAEVRNGQPSDAAETLGRSAEGLERIVASGSGATDPVRRAAELADKIVDLIGRQNALAECRRLGEEVRRIGAVQDRTLSKCRMVVRWIGQQARTSATADPRAIPLAKNVRTRAEALLRNQ